MSDKKETLLRLDNSKLMYIVKNYKQYGYDEDLKEDAREILKERGINEEDLAMAGNSQSQNYEIARKIGNSFLKNARWAISLYIFLLVSKLSALALLHYSESLGVWVGIFYLLGFILYLVFLIRSAFDHTNFYKAIGKELSTGDQLIYFFIGGAFFIFIYFQYKSPIKEELQMIR